MNNKLLSMTMALPIVFIQVCQSLTSYHASSLNTSHFFIHSGKMIQVIFNIKDKPPFLIAARDDKKKECRWVGSCDDEVTSK